MLRWPRGAESQGVQCGVRIRRVTERRVGPQGADLLGMHTGTPAAVRSPGVGLQLGVPQTRGPGTVCRPLALQARAQKGAALQGEAPTYSGMKGAHCRRRQGSRAQ